MRAVWIIRLAGSLLLLLVIGLIFIGPPIAKHLGGEPWLGVYPDELVGFGRFAGIALALRLLIYGFSVRWRLVLVFGVTIVATLVAENITWTTGGLSYMNDEATGFAIWFFVFPVAALSLVLAAIPMADRRCRTR
jgi:hypothetical protein